MRFADMTRRLLRRALATGLATSLAAAPAAAQSLGNPAIADDGSVAMPALTLPFSEFASDAARRAFVADARQVGPTIADGDYRAARAHDAVRFAPVIARMRALWPVTITPTTIGGVYTEVVTPAGGPAPANRRRVLIELHGGAFAGCPRTCGEIESIPVAGTGGVTVVAVDYRQGPEHRFPAASEDVATVYRALLKRYRPAEIGIFGGSAGGVLTAEAIAWFQHVGLPRPGAIAILSASASGWAGGDSSYLAFPAVGATRWGGDGPRRTVADAAYFAGADVRDPLVAPVWTPAVLRRFPPTLLVTSTRDFALSAAIHTDRALDAAGVPHELALWDGLPHYFYADPDLPESRAAYAKVTGWFAAHLGARSVQPVRR